MVAQCGIVAPKAKPILPMEISSTIHYAISIHVSHQPAAIEVNSFSPRFNTVSSLRMSMSTNANARYRALPDLTL